jgi:hypothetical protein
MQHDVPFFENTDDNTHCFQAVIRMTLAFFEPGNVYTWKKLEQHTAKVDGLWTWPTAGILWLHNTGYTTTLIELFDYNEFVRGPESYLHKLFGAEVADAQIQHSDLKQEVALAKQLLASDISIHRTPALGDIIKSLSKEHLVIANVNARALYGKEGYSGHFVLLIGYDDNGLFLHDPGLPGRAGVHVPYDQFESAWAYPNEQAKNVITIGKYV